MLHASREVRPFQPEWRRAAGAWPIDLSSDPKLCKSLDLLRQKWNEVPFTMLDRIKTAELGRLSDSELMRLWNRGFAERAPIAESGWAHLVYRDVFRGKKVLDVGSGLGFDSIHFARHGAKVTFLDIAAENLEVVRRVCALRSVEDASFCHLQDLDSLQSLPPDFDFIYAEGSLINAPLEMMRTEIQAFLEHLPVGGRLVTLAYPKVRWEREGRLPEQLWGTMTDGGAPWMEWHDLDKMRYFFAPATFDVVLHFEHHNSDYNWFDLLRTS